MFSERYKRLTPYTPGEQPQNRKYIKLNTNENPFPPTPLIKEFLQSVDSERLRLYPDPSSAALKDAIASYYHIPSSHIFTGNGSDEVLSFCFYAFFDSTYGPVLFPEHTYSFYPVYCSYYDIAYKRIPLQKDFSILLEQYTNDSPYSGIIFPNPNAPTGILTNLTEINQLMKSVPKETVVIIDEAYIDFGGETAIPLTEEFNNLLVVQTFSKSRALPGARIGFAVGNPQLVNALTAVKDSFNSYPLDYLSQKIGEIALSDKAYFTMMTSRIIENRTFISREFTKRGWEVLPSSANFIFTRKKGRSGKAMYTLLKEKGILVRHFDEPGIEDFLRITIGRREDMEQLLTCVGE